MHTKYANLSMVIHYLLTPDLQHLTLSNILKSSCLIAASHNDQVESPPSGGRAWLRVASQGYILTKNDEDGINKLPSTPLNILNMLSTSKLVRASPRLFQASRSLATTANAASATENKNILELPKTAEINEEFSEVFEVPKRVTPTHDIPVCNLQMRGYLPQQLDFFADFARRAAFHMGMPCSGTVPLPTQTSRWTVIRSPFVHKKSQENFERKTHKRLLQIKDAHPEVVERWIRYLTMNAPAGIGMRATKIEFESLGKK